MCGCIASRNTFWYSVVWFPCQAFSFRFIWACIPERDFWLHSLVFTFCVQIFIIYDLSFTIHQFINSSIFHHSPFINSSCVFFIFSIPFSSSIVMSLFSDLCSQVQRTWNLRLTWRNLPGLRWMRPINLKALKGCMVDGGTWWNPVDGDQQIHEKMAEIC